MEVFLRSVKLVLAGLAVEGKQPMSKVGAMLHQEFWGVIRM